MKNVDAIRLITTYDMPERTWPGRPPSVSST